MKFSLAAQGETYEETEGKNGRKAKRKVALKKNKKEIKEGTNIEKTYGKYGFNFLINVLWFT